MKALNVKALFCSFLIINFLQQLACDLVHIKVRNTKNDDYIEMCSLYRGPTLTFTYIDSLQTTPNFNICDTSSYNFGNLIKNSLIYYKLDKNAILKCGLDDLESDLVSVNVLSIIGLENSVVLNLNKTFNPSMLFISNKDSSQLDSFLIDSNNTNVELKKRSNPFDVSILFVVMTGLLTAICGAIWNRFKFKKDVSNTLRSSLNFYTPDPNSNEAKTQNKSHVNDDIDTNSFFYKIRIRFESLLEHGFIKILIGVTIFILYILLVVLINVAFDVMEIILSILFALLSGYALCSFGFNLMGFLNILTCEIPANNIPLLKQRPQIRHLFYCTLVVIFCAVWFSFRKSYWAWFLQDVLVVALVLKMISFTLFKSYSTCIAVMSIFLLADIFLIFFMPLITSEYKVNKSLFFGMQASIYSVHEQSENNHIVNFNIDKGDSDFLPFYFIIPNIMPVNTICNDYYDFPYTILGIGEILIPAISLNYAVIFDLSNRITKIPMYSIVNLISLIFGYFFVTLMVSLVYINQPGLMWVLPFMVGFSIGLAFYKKQFTQYLFGQPIEGYMIANSKK